jgi:hypothetical protein
MTLSDNNTASIASRRVVFNPYARKRPRTDSSTPHFNVQNNLESVQRQSLPRAPTCNQQPGPQATTTDNDNIGPSHNSSSHVHSEFSANHGNITATSNCRSNSVSHGVSLHSEPAGRVNAASAVNIARHGQTCDNKRYSLNSSDGSSIDWDEAIRVADTTTQVFMQSPAAVKPTAMLNSPSTNRMSANQTLYSSSPVVDLAQNAMGSGPTASNHGRTVPSPVNPYASPAKLPPRLPTAGRQHSHNMASLRPAAWSNNGADNGQANQKEAAAASSYLFSQRQGQFVASPSAKLHPSIAALPKELRFSPEVIHPAKDGRTAELVKHAQLGQPLANGWTLLDHQKRAICMGLRMRRAIIALDMGLGECS